MTSVDVFPSDQAVVEVLATAQFRLHVLRVNDFENGCTCLFLSMEQLKEIGRKIAEFEEFERKNEQ